jgi:hypothetical protein
MDAFKISEKQQSATLIPEIMDASLLVDLARGRVVQVSVDYPYVCSPLGFTPKEDGTLRRIHDLS